MDTSSSTNPERWLCEAAFVHRLARALLRDQDLAHDVAQEALAAALARQEAPSHLRGWLASVTRRLAGRVLRRHRQQSVREARAARPEANDGEERTAARLRLHRRLTDAVLALPEPYRTAVTLRYFDGLSPRAIARRRGISAEAARQQIHRGLVLLRGQLDGEFGDRRGWMSAFAVLGLGAAHFDLVLWILPVVTMKKLAVAALLVLSLTVWALMPEDLGAPPRETGPAVGSAGLPIAPPAASPATSSAPALQRTAVLLTLEVVDDQGQPVPSAEVRCWGEDLAVALERTDPAGLVQFTPRDGAGGVLVQASGRPPLLQALPSMSGEHRLVLPGGGVLAGSVLVDGAPAPAGLLLSLIGPAIEVPASAPKAISDLLASWRPQSTAATTEGGRFAFAGLAADWSGSVEVPQTHWLLFEPSTPLDSYSPRQLPVAAPRTDLVVATTKLPTVEGRVVWDDDGLPVPRPDLMAWGRFADGGNSPNMGAAGGEDGRFAVGFYPSSRSQYARWADPARRSRLELVQLRVNGPGSAGAQKVELDAAQLASTTELVVRLRRSPVTHFLALDADLTPIHGARVQGRPISEPTGADGRGTFVGPTTKLLVGSPGHMVGPAAPRAPAKGTAEDPLVLVLVPRNTLTLRLRTPSGEVPERVRLVIQSEGGDLFAGRRFQGELDVLFGSSEADGSRTGKNQPDGTTTWREWTSSVMPDERGEAVLHSLEPGVACQVAVRDALDADVVTQRFVTPGPGQALVLDLVVTQSARHLRGHVLDRAGRPVPQAEVRIGDGRADTEVRTLADGAFAAPPIYSAAPLRIEVRAAGFVPQAREVASGDPELLFRLEPGRTVTVRVAEDGGELVPVDVHPELELLDGQQAQVLQPGEVRWGGLPTGVVTFACQLGGRRFAVAHDTAGAEVTLRVPRPARITVTAPAGWPTPNRVVGSLIAVATSLDEPATTVGLELGKPDAKAVFLLPGRWRIALVLRECGEPGQAHDLVQGPAEDVTLRAGELTRVQLR